MHEIQITMQNDGKSHVEVAAMIVDLVALLRFAARLSELAYQRTVVLGAGEEPGVTIIAYKTFQTNPDTIRQGVEFSSAM